MRPRLDDCVVIFDLDGTLIDTADDLAAAMNAVLAAEGLAALPTARVRHLVGHGAKAMIRAGFAAHGAAPPHDIAPHLAHFLRFYLDNIAVSSRPFLGVGAALAALKSQGAAAAICTNKKEAWARALLAALGLTAEFSAIVGADTAGAAKPDARPVLHAMKEAGRRQAVFVGDSDYDIDAARAATVPVIIAEFGYGPLERADLAAARFGGFDELPALIARTAQGFRR